MPGCTAPVRGHYSQNAANRCPACQGALHVPCGTSLARPPAAPPTAPRQTIASGHTDIPLDDSARASTDAWQAVWNLVSTLFRTGPDAAVQQAVENAARELLTSHKPSNHWLCQMLGYVADALDPDLLVDELTNLLKSQLIKGGLTPIVAGYVATAFKQVAKHSLPALVSWQQARLTLWMIILLVCPNPDGCERTPKASIELLKKVVSDDSDS